ncbi:hypothetical protein BCR42DRAFT_418723 [Absidia repens]|uniref:Uncharacterized protein n=1 Tax=Absidia repens TaxID=90262 RepID=A0A1X2IBY9_9FUNG|nr:hypothetical protein BCR42DRAFT_418723 [Absidia repens]
MASRRKLVYLRITPITILEVLIFVTSDQINYDDALQATILTTLYDEILKHLTVISGKLVTKKQHDLETSRTINPGGEFSISYHFKWLDTHQAILLRDTPAQGSSKKSRYKPMSVYPYQLLVKVEDPQKVESLYTYFSTAV